MAYMVVLLLAAILAAVIALQNTVSVSATLLIWKLEGSLALVMIVTLIVGVVIGMLSMVPLILKVKNKKVIEQKTAQEPEVKK